MCAARRDATQHFCRLKGRRVQRGLPPGAGWGGEQSLSAEIWSCWPQVPMPPPISTNSRRQPWPGRFCPGAAHASNAALPCRAMLAGCSGRCCHQHALGLRSAAASAASKVHAACRARVLGGGAADYRLLWPCCWFGLGAAAVVPARGWRCMHARCSRSDQELKAASTAACTGRQPRRIKNPSLTGRPTAGSTLPPGAW